MFGTVVWVIKAIWRCHSEVCLQNVIGQGLPCFFVLYYKNKWLKNPMGRPINNENVSYLEPDALFCLLHVTDRPWHWHESWQESDLVYFPKCGTTPLVRFKSWHEISFISLPPSFLFIFLFFLQRNDKFSISSPHGVLQKIMYLCPSLNSQTSWENLRGKRTRVTLSPPSPTLITERSAATLFAAAAHMATSSRRHNRWETLNLNIVGPPVTHLHSRR